MPCLNTTLGSHGRSRIVFGIQRDIETVSFLLLTLSLNNIFMQRDISVIYISSLREGTSAEAGEVLRFRDRVVLHLFCFWPSLSTTNLCKDIFLSLTFSAYKNISLQKQERFCDTERYWDCICCAFFPLCQQHFMPRDISVINIFS